MENKPIKRGEHIVPFSRDHHSGLLFCWKIREGVNMQVPLLRIKPYVAYDWNEYSQEHFQEEETLLLSKVNGPLCEQALGEHWQMRLLFEKIVRDDAAVEADYKALETLVRYHIRFEERELFPFLQGAMTEKQLAVVGETLYAHHATPWEDKYADEFWVKKVN